MLISQKCQYGLRAILELAKRDDRTPVKVAEIADAQAIPARFLEGILGELRRGGFVESRRGASGGYLLARSPKDLTVGEVIGFLQGPIGPVHCLAGERESRCPLYGRCAFLPMWEKAREALSNVFEGTTFAELVSADRAAGRRPYVPSYAI